MSPSPNVPRIAFRVWAWVLTLFIVTLFSGLTIFTIGAWITGNDTMTNPVTDLGFFALGGVIVGGGFAFQLKSPELHVAALQQALVGVLALAAAGLIGGREEPLWGGLIFLAGAVLLAALHPAWRELLAVRRPFSRPLAVMSILAAFPAAAYATSMVMAARGAGASCFLGRCARGDRFAELAALAVTIVLIGLLAALKSRGWMIAATSAGVSAFLVGIGSIALPDVAGSLGATWGAIAVAWGVLMVAVVGSEGRAIETLKGTAAR